jgi:hypothetical protein
MSVPKQMLLQIIFKKHCLFMHEKKIRWVSIDWYRVILCSGNTVMLYTCVQEMRSSWLLTLLRLPWFSSISQSECQDNTSE